MESTQKLAPSNVSKQSTVSSLRHVTSELSFQRAEKDFDESLRSLLFLVSSSLKATWSNISWILNQKRDITHPLGLLLGAVRHYMSSVTISANRIASSECSEVQLQSVGLKTLFIAIHLTLLKKAGEWNKKTQVSYWIRQSRRHHWKGASQECKSKVIDIMAKVTDTMAFLARLA